MSRNSGYIVPVTRDLETLPIMLWDQVCSIYWDNLMAHVKEDAIDLWNRGENTCWCFGKWIVKYRANRLGEICRAN